MCPVMYTVGLGDVCGGGEYRNWIYIAPFCEHLTFNALLITVLHAKYTSTS